jgi:hypothetical protein
MAPRVPGYARRWFVTEWYSNCSEGKETVQIIGSGGRPAGLFRRLGPVVVDKVVRALQNKALRDLNYIGLHRSLSFILQPLLSRLYCLHLSYGLAGQGNVTPSGFELT